MASGAETFTKVVAPSLGLILSNTMFLAPLSQVRAVRRSGSLGALNPIPYPVIFTNCVLWCMYGCMRNDYYVFFSNSQGVVLGVWFTLSTLPLADPKGRRLVEQMFTGATAALVIVGLAAGLALPPDAAVRFVGLAATAAALAYYAAPLSTLWDVIRTRNAASLSLPLCVASLLNASLWSTYGAAVGDWNILTPNLPGLACGVLQLALLFRFRGGPKAQAGPPAGGAAPGYDRLAEDAESGAAVPAGPPSSSTLLPAGRAPSGGGERTLSPRRPSATAAA